MRSLGNTLCIEVDSLHYAGMEAWETSDFILRVDEGTTLFDVKG